MQGVCEACLDFCAAADWKGWRAKGGNEWWKKGNSADIIHEEICQQFYELTFGGNQTPI